MSQVNLLLADDRSTFESAFRVWVEQFDTFQLVGVINRASTLLKDIESIQPDVLLLNWDLPDLKLIQDKVRLINNIKTRFPALHMIVLSSKVAIEQYIPSSVGYLFVSKTEPPEELKNILLRLSAKD